MLTFLLRLAVLFALLLLGSSAAAGKEPLQQGLRLLASPQPQDLPSGVASVADSDSPSARAILEALRDNRLHVDSANRILILRDGRYFLGRTGAEVDGGQPLRQVRLNNAARRVLDRALARLALSATDPKVRLDAAQRLAQQPDPELGEWVRSRRDADPDPAVREALSAVVAKVDLTSPDRDRRLAAARTLATAGDLGLVEDLQARLALGVEGNPVEPDAEVRQAVRQGLSAIRQRIWWTNLLANTIYGLSLGSVLLLAALGLAITFGLMRVINMAHGEMLMIGAYTTFVVQNQLSRRGVGWLDWYLAVAIPAAFVVTALVGMLLERTVIRFLYGRPLETLLATWGLSLLLIQSVRTTFGAQNVAVANPDWLSGGWDLMPTLVVPYSRVAVLGFTAVVVAFVWYVLQCTRLGLRVRAVTQNREMAASLGVATRRVDTWTFGLGSGVAGLGGVALSQLGNVGPELGQQHIIDSFMVVVLGGVGNLLGTVLAALGLGIANKFLEPVAGAVLGKILILTLVILFIQWRPQGLFALKGRAAEG